MTIIDFWISFNTNPIASFSSFTDSIRDNGTLLKVEIFGSCPAVLKELLLALYFWHCWETICGAGN